MSETTAGSEGPVACFWAATEAVGADRDDRAEEASADGALITLDGAALAALADRYREVVALVGVDAADGPGLPVSEHAVHWISAPAWARGRRARTLTLWSASGGRALWVEEALARSLSDSSATEARGRMRSDGLRWAWEADGAGPVWTEPIRPGYLLGALMWATDDVAVAREAAALCAETQPELMAGLLYAGLGPEVDESDFRMDATPVERVSSEPFVSPATLRPLLTSGEPWVREAALDVLGRGVGGARPDPGRPSSTPREGGRDR